MAEAMPQPDTRPQAYDRSAKTVPKMSFASVAAMAPPVASQSSEDVKGLTDSLLRHKLDDEKTHLSISSNTALSLDGKSVTSGATFALDEKESIRPDDSASVKAAEDDDSNSGPASGEPNSRYGSEAGSKAFRWGRRIGPAPSDEIRRGALASPIALTGVQTGLPRPDVLPASGPILYSYKEPDEKLLEAMENPKDRLFLLQLERQVISFIQDSTEPLLDLPPCNSFYRLLAHRLGDYYALSHFVDNSVSAVRLYRTPYCQLRPSLSDAVRKLSATEETRPIPPSMKIMRRAGTNEELVHSSGPNTNELSASASKATSEAGDDMLTSPAESTSVKDKTAITREQREAKYREARERIFADYKESEKTESPVIEDGGVASSRASSTTSKRKKKTRNLDDGFDSRSAYNLYYPVAQRSGPYYDQNATQGGYYNPYMPQPGGPVATIGFQPPYPQYPSMPPMGQIPGYQYQPQMPPYQMAPMQPTFGPATTQYQYPQYPPQQQPRSPFFAAGQPPHPPAGIPPALPSPALSHSSHSSRPQSQLSEQVWNQAGYPYPYNMHGNAATHHSQPHPTSQAQYPTPSPGYSVPSFAYPYGQLPYQPNGQGSRPSHPIPGSYNRQHFNPQSKVFVPGQGGGGEVNGTSSRPASAASHSLSASGRSSGPAVVQPSSWKSTGSDRASQSPQQSTISKWATPATLPPKPPPPESEVTPAGAERSTEAIPSFRNGTYSRPAL